MDRITLHARVTGHVQGVGFRAWTRSRARAHGLDGWVRNADDGSVNAVFSGEREHVLAMVDELWAGPGAASVTDVQTDEWEGTPPESGFEIRL